MALVLKKFRVATSADAEGPLVVVQGRSPGLLGFILTALKLDDSTSLVCFHDRIEYKKSSLWGERSLTIPASAVTGILGGYKKPLGYLFGAAAAFVIGIALYASSRELALLAVSLIASIGLVVMYILKKEMTLGVQNGGDTIFAIAFNRSVIENVAVDFDKVNAAVSLINRVVLRSRVN